MFGVVWFTLKCHPDVVSRYAENIVGGRLDLFADLDARLHDRFGVDGFGHAKSLLFTLLSVSYGLSIDPLSPRRSCVVSRICRSERVFEPIDIGSPVAL